jgi:hypothetical protein
MKKSVKKYQPGGLVDSEGNPVRDGSGNPIMTGSFPDEDEITARGRAKNAEMFKSLVNRVTGRGKEAAPAATPAPAPAPAPAAEQKAAPKFSDGDVDERDRRMEAAASAPKRMPTRPGQSSSGTKPKTSSTKPKTSGTTSTRPGQSSSSTKAKTSTPTVSSSYRSEGTNKAKPADKPSTPAASNKKPPPFEMPITKFFRGLRERGDADLKSRGMKKGGSVSSASKRADGIAQRGKTRGRMY